MIEARALADLLASGRFSVATERLAQDDIEVFLAARLPLGCALSREHRLGAGDRPDFLVDDGVVVEVKVKGAARAATFRQLKRYAAYAQVRGIVLCTNVAQQLPPDIDGKPAFVVSMGRGWL